MFCKQVKLDPKIPDDDLLKVSDGQQQEMAPKCEIGNKI